MENYLITVAQALVQDTDMVDEYRDVFPKNCQFGAEAGWKKQVDKKKSDDYDKISHSADSVPALSGKETVFWNILREQFTCE